MNPLLDLSLGACALSFSLSDLALGLNLALKLLFPGSDLLWGGVLHRLLSGVDACTVLLILLVGTEHAIPPPKGSGVVVGEGHMVKVMVLGTRPEGKDMLKRPGEVVSRMGINGLEKTKGDPDVHREDVEVLGKEAVEEGASEGAGSKNEDLGGVSVFSSKTEGSGVLVVDLVDMLVEGTVMESLVSKVVEEVFEDEEKGNLRSDSAQGREGNLVGRHAESLSQGVEQPNSREFNGEVGEQDTLGTFPLLGGGRNLCGLEFPLPEVGNPVDDDPGNAATKVNNLVKKERHQPSSNNGVANPNVPSSPILFQPVELRKVGTGI